MKRTMLLVLIGVVAFFGAKPCAAGDELLGAGATFPYPLYSKMFDVYNRQTGVKVNYQSIGSGGGIRQLLNRTVDFGATDAFMGDEELQKAPAQIVHVPTCLGAVVVTYNLPGNPELRLTPDVLAAIFLGKVTKWNDPRIAEINPDAKLPEMKIVIIHRSDGSGTTFIFTDYLSKVSGEWKDEVGRGKSVNWPVGLGAKGNEGVSGLIKQVPGAIGYAELAYTTQNHLPQAWLRNASGNFIRPSLESASLAADTKLPEDTRVSLTNTDAPDGYPIAGFTWIILYKGQDYGSRTTAKADALVKLVWWMTHEGQQYTRQLDYAPLPAQAQQRAEAILRSVDYRGEGLIH